jgi:tRNA-dihydrouridine synthase A
MLLPLTPSFKKMCASSRWAFSIAPMMDWTDRHCRFFHRQLTRHALLYTEMVTADALIHGPREQLLNFHEDEHPVALQLGGSDPDKLAQAARWGAEKGYDEINLNCGCPSDRVQSGAFGAVLMKEPERVAACVKAMQKEVSCPVTVKCRIGVDDQDDFDFLLRFAEAVFMAGSKALIVHARKAWLKGLSPKENREIPPLNYERVYALKKRFSDQIIVLNGGLMTLEQAIEAQGLLDGVMLGRAAYQNPGLLADVDQMFFGSKAPVISAHNAVLAMRPYIEDHLDKGGRLHHITRHMVGLFQGQKGAKLWRRTLSEQGIKPDAGWDVVEEALSFINI